MEAYKVKEFLYERDKYSGVQLVYVNYDTSSESENQMFLLIKWYPGFDTPLSVYGQIRLINQKLFKETGITLFALYFTLSHTLSYIKSQKHKVNQYKEYKDKTAKHTSRPLNQRLLVGESLIIIMCQEKV